MRKTKRLLCISCFAIGTGLMVPSTTAQTQVPPTSSPPPVIIHTPPPIPATLSLRGTKILFYDFLDVREAEYTPAVLNEVESQLTQELGQDSINVHLVRFKDTPPGLTFANAIGGAMIPVAEVINSQKTKEAEIGIRYRLIAFPSDYQSIGSWRHYSIRWLVIDATNDQIILRSEYSGKHLVMWKESENAVARGKKLVDHIIMEMRAKSLI
jgi:hypothetical protein